MTTCPNSGLTIPECPCPDCCLRLLSEMKTKQPSKAWAEVLERTHIPSREVDC